MADITELADLTESVEKTVCCVITCGTMAGAPSEANELGEELKLGRVFSYVTDPV